GDVEPSPAVGAKVGDGPCKAVDRREQRLIAQFLPGLAGKRGVDLRRLAVGDRVADDGVAVHGRVSWSVGADAVAALELPGAGDLDDVVVLADVGREGGIGCRHLHDPHRGVIQHLVAGAALYADLIYRAVGADRHRQQQAAVELAARGVGVVQRAHALDLLPPVLDVLREAVFLRARADELLARALGQLLQVAVDLGFEAGDGRGTVEQVEAADLRWRLRLGHGLLDLLRRGSDLGGRFFASDHLFLVAHRLGRAAL